MIKELRDGADRDERVAVGRTIDLRMDDRVFRLICNCGRKQLYIKSMDARWVVATTKAGRENWAIENLARKDCPHYFPHITELVRSKHKREMRIRPLFPRYIFVQITDRWRFLLSTWGIQGVLMGAAGPALVPHRTIDQLKAMEDPDGLILLPKLRPRTIGDRVKIIDGAMKGFSGIYQGQHSKDREKVLIAYLGRRTQVLVASELLEAA